MATTIRGSSTIALALAAAALAVPAGARELAPVEGWDLTTDGKACTMASTFKDDVSIGLIWSPQTGELGFLATIPRPNEVRNKATAQMQVSFDGDSPFTQWEDDRAAVVSGPDNDALVANWGAAHSGELAKAMSAASHVKLRVGDKDIGTYDLAGSPAAYRALTRCGETIASR